MAEQRVRHDQEDRDQWTERTRKGAIIGTSGDRFAPVIWAIMLCEKPVDLCPTVHS